MIKSETARVLSIYDKRAREWAAGCTYRSGMTRITCILYVQPRDPRSPAVVTWLHERTTDALRGLGLTGRVDAAATFLTHGVLLGAFFTDAFLNSVRGRGARRGALTYGFIHVTKR